jgi:hypothetical protein
MKVTDWNSTPYLIVDVNMGVRRRFVVLCCTFIPLQPCNKYLNSLSLNAEDALVGQLTVELTVNQ